MPSDKEDNFIERVKEGGFGEKMYENGTRKCLIDSESSVFMKEYIETTQTQGAQGKMTVSKTLIDGKEMGHTTLHADGKTNYHGSHDD